MPIFFTFFNFLCKFSEETKGWIRNRIWIRLFQMLTIARQQLLNALDKLVPVAECRDADLLEVLVAHLSQDVNRDLLPIKHLHKTMLLIDRDDS